MHKYTKLAFSLPIPLYMLYSALEPSSWHFVDNIDLIFHEAGHTIFFFLPEMMTIMAGSIFQVLVPLIVVFHFLRKSEFISSGIVLSWVGQSIINVSVYAKDSALMQLPLLGGDSVIHDWNYIMTRLGILEYTNVVWVLIYLSGIIVIVTSIFIVIYYSIEKKREPIIYASDILPQMYKK